MKSIKLATLLTIVLLQSALLQAQHNHTDHRADTTRQKNTGDQHNHHAMVQSADSVQRPPMTNSFSRNLPMNRNGSGTGWLPDAAPMYGYMVHSKKWMYMFHGNIVLRYNQQDVAEKGTRGDTKLDAPNWFMTMGQRAIGKKGLFHFNTMFSLDALFGGDGYPMLFQTGESYKGRPLVDRQHPHDFFSELSVAYTQSFTKDFDAFVYFGFPGEPALGPVAFMHRPSSQNIPNATLGHHWSDATHITFGVGTVGFRYKIFKLDGSLFTGREPNEFRYDFDKPRFDSYAYRLTVNPTKSISLQASRGFIKSPEALHAEENVQRTTASINHALPLRGENKFLTSAFVWGHNNSGDHHKENSFTVESNLQLDRLALYGRYESVEKTARELVLEDNFDHDIKFNLNAITVGLNYSVLRQAKTNFSLGVQGTFYSTPLSLQPIYGKNPVSAEVYLRVSPTLMKTINQ
jgi:hypothetical protein